MERVTAIPLTRNRLRTASRALGKRLAVALATLWLISVVTFGATAGFRSAREIAQNALGRDAAPIQLQAYITSHHLNEPLVTRYASWLSASARGDLGTSQITGESVWSSVRPRLGRSLLLALLAAIIGVPFAVGLGIYAGRRVHTRRDLGMLVVSVVVAAIPEFVLAIVLILVFAVWLNILPVDSTAIGLGHFAQQAEAYVLPTVALIAGITPQIFRLTRVAVQDALSQPYTQAAMLRGLSNRTIVYRNALPNVGVTVANVIALNVLWLLSGVIIVETVFAFPGVGQLLLQAISDGDTATVQAAAMIFGALFVAITMVTDGVVAYLNPKLRDSL